MTAISASEINLLIFDFFSALKEYQLTTMQDLYLKLMLVDDSYSPVTRDDMLAIAGSNPLKVPGGTPKTDLTDCDDYALQLKALITARYRQRSAEKPGLPPPAVALVISQNHAVNLFVVQDEQGVNSLCFIDACAPGAPMAAEPEAAARIMKGPPVRLIYM